MVILKPYNQTLATIFENITDMRIKKMYFNKTDIKTPAVLYYLNGNIIKIQYNNSILFLGTDSDILFLSIC